MAAMAAGCSTAPYDAGAVPDARAGLDRHMDDCALRTRNREFTTATGMVDCYVSADRAYADAIGLRRTDLFAAYAARMTQLGRDLDAGRIGKAEASNRFDSLRKNYYASLDAAYRRDEPNNQMFAKVLAAIGQGLAQKEAASPGR